MTTDADVPATGTTGTDTTTAVRPAAAPDQGVTQPETAGRTARPGALGLILAAIVGAEFILQLDATIVAVALPNLQEDLGLSAGSLSWVVNGFLLAFGGLLLFGGRLGDVVGHRTTFIAGTSLLAAASLLAGLASNVGLLLTGRVLQGAGAALAGPAGLALLATTFTGARQQRAFAVYSTVTGLAASAGMVLGGILTDLANWRWTLLINAPIGVAVALLTARVVPSPSRSDERRALDVPGAVLSVIGMTALVYGFVAAAEDGWDSGRAVAGLVGGVAVLAGFVLREAQASSPLLPLRVVTHRGRAGAFVNLLLMAFALTGFLFFLTQFLQRVLELEPLVTGLAFLPFGVSLLLAARAVPKILTRLNPRALAILGFAVMALALFWLSRLGNDSDYATGILVPIILLGAGAGAAVVPLNIIILSQSAPEEIGVTSGVLQSALSVGGSLGIAILLTLYTAADDVAGGVTRAFTGGAVIAAVAVVLGLVFWYLPGRRPAEAAA
ncbi:MULTISPECIES: MFS transporter [Protofrankia]|uniref:Major facilitator superfamily MFS_1 n=1 Tax=Candidatus Protofrankia datiscae TaxID=2716812 RepID=F8AWP5_9ACTN|nr:MULTISPECIES: MFS transporter [Protofrankia]AEH09389.1 major facilitator superfamily MFS_1 [Candidatus Protofrankia datiscae]